VRDVEAAAGDMPALLVAAEAAMAADAAAVQQIARARAFSRSRQIAPELREALVRARVVRRDAVAAVREARRAVLADPGVVARRDAVNDRAGELRRGARELCGVYWGTYLLVEAAMEASSAMPLYEGTEPNDPHFVRWSGEGAIGVQVAGGLATAQLFGEGAHVQVDQVDAVAWHSPVKGERRRASRTKLRVRVGSTGPGNRTPIWAEFPMIMHREMGRGAIKAVKVCRRLIGRREEWSVQFTVALEAPRKAPREGVVAIDVGWRKIGEDIRVACWESGAGERGELRLSAALLGQIAKADELRSTRDDGFNRARLALSAWVGKAPRAEWLAQATETLDRWKSPERLYALAVRWQAARFEEDAEGYDALEAWRYHDHHLREWECSQRVKSLRHRREVYRTFAAGLSNRFGTIVLEKFDLRKVAATPALEASGDNSTARSQRHGASVSELRLVLTNAFHAKDEVPAAYTTLECFACRHIEEFAADKELEHTCLSCGVTWDQDENAAKVILRRWIEGAALKASDATESKWVKAKRGAEAKKSRKTIGTASECVRSLQSTVHGRMGTRAWTKGKS